MSSKSFVFLFSEMNVYRKVKTLLAKTIVSVLPTLETLTAGGLGLKKRITIRTFD